MCPQGSRETGAAWLSSARVVRCWVKSRNERNPYAQLPSSKVGHSVQTARVNREEGGDDVKSSWPLHPGLHTYYNGTYKGSRNREVKPIPKTVESLVILDQHARVNAFPGLVHTARHTTKVGFTRSR